jgi:hypothetical protein
MELPEHPAHYVIKTITRLSCASLLFFVISCSQQPHKLPTWMSGVWKSSFNDVDVRETWECGNGFMTGSTVWSWDGKQRKEKLRLAYVDDSLVYYIRLEDNKLLKFVCTDAENDTLVFVNNKNDFPKRLVYVRPSGKKMSVWIDNEEKDPNRISFPFEKVVSR